MTVLEAKQLQKQYALGELTVKALDLVDFRLEKGEFVAIMGPSGSGKSTLLHLLGGLDNPSSGTVFLADRQLSDIKDKEATLARRHNIGFIFQFFNLVPTLNAEENILLPLIIDGKDPKDYKSTLDELLDLVGLSNRRFHRPDQLSGGEQQRVAIARALITKPSVVLADEPTGNLDTKSGKVIMELLRQSCDKFNQSIVEVTHDPRAASYADRVVFLQDGKILEEIKLEKELSASFRLKRIINVLEKIEA